MFQRFTPMLMIGAMVCLCAVARCDDPDAPKAQTITVTGIVKPAAPDAEEAATIKAGKEIDRIVKDAKGIVVARDAAGKKAEIKGTVEERDGIKWITVTWCALVE